MSRGFFSPWNIRSATNDPSKLETSIFPFAVQNRFPEIQSTVKPLIVDLGDVITVFESSLKILRKKFRNPI
jgi:hypothetical protein